MRVSDSSLYLKFLRELDTSRGRIDNAVDRLTDGKRVRRPSDDPAGARSAMQLRAKVVRLEGFDRSSRLARFDLSTVDTVLGEVFNILSTARAEGLAGANTTGNQSNSVRAEEIDALREQLLALGNTFQDGRYLFGGTNTQSEPFDTNGGFSGDTDEIQVPVDPNRTVSSNLSGQDVFLDGGDVFQILEDLATALRANDSDAINAMLPDFNNALDHINEIRTRVGTRLQLIDRTLDQQGDERLRLQTRIAEIEDISPAEAAVELTSATEFLDALSATAARVLGRSLFDFLG